MKKLIVIFLMAIVTPLYSQLALESYVGFGAKIDNQYNITLSQTAVSVETQYEFDRFQIVQKNIAYTNDSLVEIYAGLGFEYQLWRDYDYDAGKKRIDIGAYSLIGTEGRAQFGGSLSYSADKFKIGFDTSYEPEHGNTYLSLSAGFYILRRMW